MCTRSLVLRDRRSRKSVRECGKAAAVLRAGAPANALNRRASFQRSQQEAGAGQPPPSKICAQRSLQGKSVLPARHFSPSTPENEPFGAQNGEKRDTKRRGGTTVVPPPLNGKFQTDPHLATHSQRTVKQRGLPGRVSGSFLMASS